jgi:hypothetical protein
VGSNVRLLATALIIAALPRLGHADEPVRSGRSAALSWVRLPGAESCISTTDLAGLVELQLGRHALVSASDADLSVEARVTAGGAGKNKFRAVVTGTLRDGTALGTRDLAGQTCAELNPSLALVIALMIDPESGTRNPEAEAQPVGPTPAPAPEVIRERVEIHTREIVTQAPLAPSEASRWRVEPELAALLGWHGLPTVGVGFAGGVRGSRPLDSRWSLGLQGNLEGMPSAAVATNAGRFSVWSAAARFSACGAADLSLGLAASSCLGLRLGMLHVAPPDVQPSGLAASGAAGALLDTVLELRIAKQLFGPLYLFAAGYGSAAIASPRVVLTLAQGSQGSRLAVLGARSVVGLDVAAGLSLRFGP